MVLDVLVAGGSERTFVCRPLLGIRAGFSGRVDTCRSEKGRAGLHCRRSRVLHAKNSDAEEAALNRAAADFAKAVEAGMSPDDYVANQLGVASASNLTDVQQKYKDKIVEKLGERAEMLKEQKKNASKSFEMGKVAYGQGNYEVSVVLFEEAVVEVGEMSVVGGEAQLWLALAYQALGEESKCLLIYKDLKGNHPVKQIRRQASDLLFIMEAPRLKISEDEKVKIPVLKDLERVRPGRGPSAPRPAARIKPTKKVKKTFEDEFWENYKPPLNVPNKYVWYASCAVAIGVAWYSTLVG